MLPSLLNVLEGIAGDVACHFQWPTPSLLCDARAIFSSAHGIPRSDGPNSRSGTFHSRMTKGTNNSPSALLRSLVPHDDRRVLHPIRRRDRARCVHACVLSEKTGRRSDRRPLLRRGKLACRCTPSVYITFCALGQMDAFRRRRRMMPLSTNAIALSTPVSYPRRSPPSPLACLALPCSARHCHCLLLSCFSTPPRQRSVDDNAFPLRLLCLEHSSPHFSNTTASPLRSLTPIQAGLLAVVAGCLFAGIALDAFTMASVS